MLKFTLLCVCSFVFLAACSESSKEDYSTLSLIPAGLCFDHGNAFRTGYHGQANTLNDELVWVRESVPYPMTVSRTYCLMDSLQEDGTGRRSYVAIGSQDMEGLFGMQNQKLSTSIMENLVQNDTSMCQVLDDSNTIKIISTVSEQAVALDDICIQTFLVPHLDEADIACIENSLTSDEFSESELNMLFEQCSDNGSLFSMPLELLVEHFENGFIRLTESEEARFSIDFGLLNSD